MCGELREASDFAWLVVSSLKIEGLEPNKSGSLHAEYKIPHRPDSSSKDSHRLFYNIRLPTKTVHCVYRDAAMPSEAAHAQTCSAGRSEQTILGKACEL